MSFVPEQRSTAYLPLPMHVLLALEPKHQKAKRAHVKTVPALLNTRGHSLVRKQGSLPYLGCSSMRAPTQNTHRHTYSQEIRALLIAVRIVAVTDNALSKSARSAIRGMHARTCNIHLTPHHRCLASFGDFTPPAISLSRFGFWSSYPLTGFDPCVWHLAVPSLTD